MKLQFRILIGICFLIGALVFALVFAFQKEWLYALLLLLVGASYLYKGVRR